MFIIQFLIQTKLISRRECFNSPRPTLMCTPLYSNTHIFYTACKLMYKDKKYVNVHIIGLKCTC